MATDTTQPMTDEERVEIEQASDTWARTITDPTLRTEAAEKAFEAGYTVGQESGYAASVAEYDEGARSMAAEIERLKAALTAQGHPSDGEWCWCFPVGIVTNHHTLPCLQARATLSSAPAGPGAAGEEPR